MMMRSAMSVPAKVFYSYAHVDENLRNRLETHLAILRRNGLISEWHDRRIIPGAKWDQVIDEHVNAADVILLLISPDFLASDYCHEIEMKRALERHASGDASVIPVILRSVDWKGAPFQHLQVLPTDGKPVTSWHNLDEAFTDVACGIRRTIEDRAGQDSASVVAVASFGASIKLTRLFEGAAPTRIPVGHSRFVVGKISIQGSPMLAHDLRIDDTYAVEDTNVKSQTFEVAFPVVEGATRSISALVRLKSPDFEPKEQKMDVELSPDDGSTILPFQVKAGQTGTKFLTLELLLQNKFIVSRALRTEAEDLNPPGGPGGMAVRSSSPDSSAWSVVASLALSLLAHAQAQHYSHA
jgi:TIR domain